MGDAPNDRGLSEFALELGVIAGITNLIPNVWAGFGGGGCSRPSGGAFRRMAISFRFNP